MKKYKKITLKDFGVKREEKVLNNSCRVVLYEKKNSPLYFGVRFLAGSRFNDKDGLAHSARLADEVIWYQPEGLDWDLQPVIDAAPNKAVIARTLDDIIQTVVAEAGEGDAVVIMSNGGFGGLHQKLLAALKAK